MLMCLESGTLSVSTELAIVFPHTSYPILTTSDRSDRSSQRSSLSLKHKGSRPQLAPIGNRNRNLEDSTRSELCMSKRYENTIAALAPAFRFESLCLSLVLSLPTTPI